MAEKIGDLAYKLTVDNAQFSSGMADAGQKIDKLAKDASGSSSKIQAAFANIGTGAKGVFDSFANGGLTSAIGSATSAIEGFATTAVSSFGPVGIAAAGVVAGLAAIATQASITGKEIADIAKLANSLGESTQNVQVLQRVLGGAGLDDGSQRTLILRFFDRIGDLKATLSTGGGATGQVLRSIGLSPEAIGNAKPEAAFEAIAIALANVDDVYLRTSASQQLFGRSFVDLEPIIRRGAAAFADARIEVERTGRTEGLVRFAEGTAQLSRQTAREFGGITDSVKRFWDVSSAAIDRGLARAERGLFIALEAAGLVARTANSGGDSSPVNAAAFDPIADRTNRASIAAASLAEKWREAWFTVGLTGRALEIYKAEQEGASEEQLAQLRTNDRILSNLERQVAVQRELTNAIQAGRSASEKFADQVAKINGATLAAGDRTALLANTFRDLERSLGGGGQNFAINGVSANSVESARITADLQTRRNNGAEDVQNRVLQVLQASQEIAAQTLAENRAIAEAVRNIPGFGIAPLRGN